MGRPKKDKLTRPRLDVIRMAYHMNVVNTIYGLRLDKRKYVYDSIDLDTGELYRYAYKLDRWRADECDG